MKNTTLGLLSLFVLGIAAIGGASAFGFGFWQESENAESIKDAIENNDFDAWKAAIESQLTQDNFARVSEKHKQHLGMRQMNDEIRTAIENKDYDAYLDAVNAAEGDSMSEEDFNKLTEIHDAMQSGDFEKADELRQELGFGAGKGMGCKMKNNMFNKRRI